jgi:ATP-dependent HslUV protease, peptidase subunit HslV
MTTIAVVKKGGHCAIAADTMTKWGCAKETAGYVLNHDKILRAGESYLAITGSATFKLIVADYFSDTRSEVRLNSVEDIFRTWQRLHPVLKERYFINPEEDKEDDLESSRMDVLIANPYGIFGVAAHRTVQEFSKFYAYGSGSDYALGALYTSYDRPDLSAEDLARLAIETAAEFDDGTGLPFTSRSVPETSMR